MDPRIRELLQQIDRLNKEGTNVGRGLDNRMRQFCSSQTLALEELLPFLALAYWDKLASLHEVDDWYHDGNTHAALRTVCNRWSKRHARLHNDEPITMPKVCPANYFVGAGDRAAR